MISEERRMHWARLLVNQLWEDDLVDYTDDEQALHVARRAINKYCEEEDNIDQTVRQKLLSLKRGVVEGSTEWDTLHRKYYEEELGRRGKR